MPQLESQRDWCLKVQTLYTIEITKSVIRNIFYFSLLILCCIGKLYIGPILCLSGRSVEHYIYTVISYQMGHFSF